MARIREIWRIDDEWWRRPISRLYHEVVLVTGAILTLYRDLREEGPEEGGPGEGGWYVHGTARPAGRTRLRGPRARRTRSPGRG